MEKLVLRMKLFDKCYNFKAVFYSIHSLKNEGNLYFHLSGEILLF